MKYLEKCCLFSSFVEFLKRCGDILKWKSNFNGIIQSLLKISLRVCLNKTYLQMLKLKNELFWKKLGCLTTIEKTVF